MFLLIILLYAYFQDKRWTDLQIAQFFNVADNHVALLYHRQKKRKNLLLKNKQHMSRIMLSQK